MGCKTNTRKGALGYTSVRIKGIMYQPRDLNYVIASTFQFSEDATVDVGEGGRTSQALT